MRAGAWELARRIKDQGPPDVLFMSDYVDLPSLFGFLPKAWSEVPTLLYFHENQLTYPARAPQRGSGHLPWCRHRVHPPRERR